MRTPSEKTIKNHKYMITPMGAELATLVEAKLFRLLSEPLAKLFTAGDGATAAEGSGMSPAAKAALASAVGSLATHLDAHTVLDVVKSMLIGDGGGVTHCLRNGKALDFNNDFAGLSSEKWQVVMFAMEVNFADFFADLATSASGVAAMFKKTSESAP